MSQLFTGCASYKGAETVSTTTVETTTSEEEKEGQANELLDQTQDTSQLNSSQVKLLMR